MPTYGYATRTYQDYDNEPGVLKVGVAEFTAANYTAQSTAIATLWTAIDAITLGKYLKSEQGNRYIDPNPVAASDEAAQRELKWLVQYHDGTTGRKYSVEIPTADPAQLDPNDRAHAHIGDTDVVDAFITAFQAVVKTRDGNAAVVDEITLVGRRV